MRYLRAEWVKRISRARVSALLPRLVDELFATPIITIPQARRLLGVAYHSAQLSVEKLVDAGVLRQLGESSYGRTYVAEDVIRIISADLP